MKESDGGENQDTHMMIRSTFNPEGNFHGRPNTSLEKSRFQIKARKLPAYRTSTICCPSSKAAAIADHWRLSKLSKSVVRQFPTLNHNKRPESFGRIARMKKSSSLLIMPHQQSRHGLFVELHTLRQRRYHRLLRMDNQPKSPHYSHQKLLDQAHH